MGTSARYDNNQQRLSVTDGLIRLSGIGVLLLLIQGQPGVSTLKAALYNKKTWCLWGNQLPILQMSLCIRSLWTV